MRLSFLQLFFLIIIFFLFFNKKLAIKQYILQFLKDIQNKINN